MMEVWVERPEIAGDTITFRWSQSASNPYQTANSFYYRYEGLDLTRYSTELWYEIFLALQLRVFAAYDKPVAVHFPTPVPAFSAAYWLAHHGARHVTVSPIAERGGYNPWANEPVLVERLRKAAVFFGGGKDSTLAMCLFSEIFGAGEVVLIQFVGPLNNDPAHRDFLEERQERMMLAPARRAFGVATQRGWTNYQAIFRKEGYAYRPHLELYTVGALPALLAWGVEICTFTANWTIMSSEMRRNGVMFHRYTPSRPRSLAAQSRHYGVTLGAPIDVTNVILPFHGLAVHRLLAQRYPAMLDTMVSCTIAAPDRRWCHRCKKCALFAVSSLAIKTYVSDFDYDLFFADSPFMAAMMAYAESGVELTELGNAPWSTSWFIGGRSFIYTCHLIAMIDFENLPFMLSEKAFANLVTLIAMYGNRTFPEHEAIPRITLDLLGPKLGPAITAIVSEHFEIIDKIPEPTFTGNVPTTYQFDEPRDLPVAMLEHIRR